MKLLRVGAPGEERPAVRTEDGRLLGLSPVTSDIDGAFLASDGVDRARAEVVAGSLPELDPDGLRIGAPLAHPGKIVCVGLNYRDHAAETVNPGTADTPWVTRLLDAADDPEAERAALDARQPLGRLVTADEVAAAVVYLASPAAASVTGIALAVDGGVQGFRLRPAAGS